MFCHILEADHFFALHLLIQFSYWGSHSLLYTFRFHYFYVPVRCWKLTVTQASCIFYLSALKYFSCFCWFHISTSSFEVRLTDMLFILISFAEMTVLCHAMNIQNFVSLWSEECTSVGCHQNMLKFHWQRYFCKYFSYCFLNYFQQPLLQLYQQPSGVQKILVGVAANPAQHTACHLAYCLPYPTVHT